MPQRTQSRRTPLYTIATITGYAAFFAGMSALLCVFAPVYIVLFPLRRTRQRILQWFFTAFLAFFTRTLLPLLGVYTISDISGVGRIPSPGIIVANHRSRIDGPILLGLLRNPGVIMKSEYARMPAFSFFVRHLDFISVNQNDFTALSRALDRCRSILDSGRNLLIFPEGTRSPSARLLAFKEMGFRLAQERKVPVVPAVVHLDRPFMARIKGSTIAAGPMRLSVRFLDAVYPDDSEPCADYAQRVHRIISRELQELDKGTTWESRTQPLDSHP